MFRLSVASAYHGLVRAFVRASIDAASPSSHRALLRSIHKDLGKEGSSVLPPDVAPVTVQSPIVVLASAPGLASVTLSIPTSTDAMLDSPLAVAASMKARASFTV